MAEALGNPRAYVDSLLGHVTTTDTDTTTTTTMTISSPQSSPSPSLSPAPPPKELLFVRVDGTIDGFTHSLTPHSLPHFHSLTTSCG